MADGAVATTDDVTVMVDETWRAAVPADAAQRVAWTGAFEPFLA